MANYVGHLDFGQGPMEVTMTTDEPVSVKDAIKACEPFCAEEDESRVSLQHVCMMPTEAVATNGHILMVVPIEPLPWLTGYKLLAADRAAVLARQTDDAKPDLLQLDTGTGFPRYQQLLDNLHAKPVRSIVTVNPAYLAAIGTALAHLSCTAVQLIVRGEQEPIECIGRRGPEARATALVMPMRLPREAA
jgi:hypothetical protein